MLDPNPLSAPEVTKVVIHPMNENIDSVWTPGNRRGVVMEYAANPIPIAPFGAVPPFAVKMAIRPGGEHVETVRPP